MQRILRMNSMGMLAGSVAHDLNNMLTAIALHAELLVDDVVPGTPAYDNVQEIRTGVTRATELVRQFLRHGGAGPSHPTAVDVNAIVSRLRTMLERLTAPAIRIVCQPGNNLAPIIAEPTHIEQVLLNLVVNARDAMPAGGDIQISTRNLDVERDGLEMHAARPGLKPGRYVQLRVDDTGHGMRAEVQARIFEPFFTTKTSGNGTGLGLFTVFGIVKQTCGFIYVTSAVGRGTTFEILWPAAPEPARATDLTRMSSMKNPANEALR